MTKTAFTGGLMIDGTGADAKKNSTVLIEDGTIVYAGEEIDIPEGFEVVDITGKTIMPGIIDTHLHFSGNLTSDDSDWVLEPNLQKAIVAAQQARECIEAGLTTVGEISRFGIHVRNMIDQGVIIGPRVIATGLGFCATASHGDSHNLSSEMNKEAHPWAECVDSPWDLRKAVRRRIRENPDAIKVWSTGGGIWRWETAMDEHYTIEELRAIVEEAHMRDVPVWAHCFGSAYNSVDVGFDMIIHGFMLDDKTLDLMAEKGITFCPTIAFLPDWFSEYEPKYIPEIHDQYEGDTVTEKELNRIYSNLKKAVAKGIVITTASDSFNSKLTPYGITTIRELHAFVDKAGISTMDTIVAATLNGAKALGVENETGSLEKGKAADIIVVDGDPLRDIHELTADSIQLVMKGGTIIRSDL